MLDPELKQEFKKINESIESLAGHMADGFTEIDERFKQVDERFNQVDERFKQVDERFNQVDERFELVDLRFDRLENKLQNQVDSIAERKVDRSEFAPIKAQVLNLQKH